MPRPDLFVVGAPKCGTTAMTRYLEAHPQVFMAARKDIHHFGSDLGFTQKVRDTAESYLAHFADAGDARRVGECSVWYLYSERAAAEIRAFAPDARIIIMLRNPVDMIYALHAQLRYNGRGDEDIADFEQAIAAEPDRAAGRRIPPHATLPEALLYHRVATFTPQVRRYFDAFGRDQVHIVLQDDLLADPAATWRQVLEFLEVDPDFQPDFRVVNSNKVVRSETVRRLVTLTPQAIKDALPDGLRMRIRRTVRHLNSRHAPRPPLSPELRARLAADFRPDVLALAELIGRDLSHWLRPSGAGG